MPFIDHIVATENPQEITLATLRHSSKEIVIYGGGVYAYVLFQYLTKRGLEVTKFAVDRRYKTSDRYMGVEVVAAEDIFENMANYDVVVGIANYPDVLSRFAPRGLKLWVVDVPDFLNIPSPFMDLDFIRSHEGEFQEAYDLLEDDLSRETFVASINTKINGDLDFLKPVVRLDHLYFSQSEFPLSSNETLLDVGGFNGDSVRDFHRATEGKYRRIISLEPFPKMHAQLLKTIDELGIADRCEALRVGAWHEKTKLAFSDTEMEIDSKIREGGTAEIEVDTIDSILRNRASRDSGPISLIKMDINGAESNALRGATGVIREQRPRIAVKMHVKEDFYRLPVLLKEIAPEIKLYLRQRNHMSMMLVLYGVFKPAC